MPISTVTQSGNTVKIFNEKGSQQAMIFTLNGKLVGYTQSAVSIREGNLVKIYDEKGAQTSSIYSP